MKRPRLPSGDIVSGFPSDELPPPAPPPRPAPPPPPPRPARRPAAAVAGVAKLAHSPASDVQTVRVFLTGSTSTVWVVPSASVVRYQNRSSGNHVGATLPPTTRPLRFAARNFSARA